MDCGVCSICRRTTAYNCTSAIRKEFTENYTVWGAVQYLPRTDFINVSLTADSWLRKMNIEGFGDNPYATPCRHNKVSV